MFSISPETIDPAPRPLQGAIIDRAVRLSASRRSDVVRAFVVRSTSSRGDPSALNDRGFAPNVFGRRGVNEPPSTVVACLAGLSKTSDLLALAASQQ
jgi:hypothetical protein